MIKQDFHISNIIARHLSGEITPEENAQLEKWRKADSAHEALFRKFAVKRI
jgi:transmembrane sensor